MPSSLSVVLLGSGAAFPPLDRENTSLALVWEGGIWLIDCSASPHRRLRLAGLDPDDLRGVLITHAHPDHLYGLPSLVHCLIPHVRRAPLAILAPPRTLACAQRILEAFALLERPEVPLQLTPLPPDPVLPPAPPLHDADGLRIWAAPVAHTIETVGVRVESRGRVLAFSSDTAPCPAVVDLARGADLLVHEATFLQTDPDGPAAGHSTAAEAGRIARTAGARRLLLVHLLPATVRDPAALQAEAEGTFGGGVVMIGEDLARYEV